MIKALWSDDIFQSEKEINTSVEFAYTNGILVVPIQTWDNAQNEIEIGGDSYDVIILDGMGQRTIDSRTDDPSHLTKAISWLSEQRGRGKDYPIVVYTGYYDNIKALYEDDGNIRAIVKKPNIEELYEKIKDIVKEKPNVKIKQRYNKAWEIFTNKILSTSEENSLLNLIKKDEANNIKNEDFNTVRILFESLLKRFNQIDDIRLLPNDVIRENGSVNFDWSIKILMGLRTEIKYGNDVVRVIPFKTDSVIPKTHHIKYYFEFVKNVASTFSHSYRNEYTLSSFSACLKALIEIFAWSNKLLIEKYSDKI
ncbi:hypothetical protein [Emticicia sp. TH156]|uniref:hypothetical protein n=1 Tax=Emticicia sp. TH156 TaxID=2067454 RepID=UPI000C78EED2|nr:hypothetical protein [Emticicia sp. TH156]PLK42120.1 hypothetical protein C0V77_22550 [Emticicia sp. TH156]